MLKQFAIAAGVLAFAAVAAAQAALVSRYTFDNPDPADAARDLDLGSDNTPATLYHGAARVAGGAYPGSGNALQSGPIADASGTLQANNNDHKAGVLFANTAASTLGGTAGVPGVTVMGWFKPTAAIATSGSTSLIGLLRGDDGGAASSPTAHDGRALIEVGGNKLTALGRRLDTEGGGRPVVSTTATIGTILPANTWTHLAAVFDFDHGTITVYRNGDVLASALSSGSFNDWALTAGVDTTSNTASNGLKIGGQLDDDTTPFTGLIDDVRVYNTTLPATGASSVQSIYLSQVPEPTPASALLAAAALLLAGGRRPRPSTRG